MSFLKQPLTMWFFIIGSVFEKSTWILQGFFRIFCPSGRVCVKLLLHNVLTTWNWHNHTLARFREAVAPSYHFCCYTSNTISIDPRKLKSCFLRIWRPAWMLLLYGWSNGATPPSIRVRARTLQHWALQDVSSPVTTTLRRQKPRNNDSAISKVDIDTRRKIDSLHLRLSAYVGSTSQHENGNVLADRTASLLSHINKAFAPAAVSINGHADYTTFIGALNAEDKDRAWSWV